jgi:flagellar P-ring protein precursor FlgI
MNNRLFRIGIILVIMTTAAAAAESAPRIKDIADIQGARANFLKGLGLVVGLGGTGDGAAAALATQGRLLRRMNIEVQAVRALNSDNVAVVMVTAELPPFAKEGTRIDVIVNSFFDATSLEGGTLLQAFLEGVDGQVYAVAQGPVAIGGFNVGAAGSGIQKNHTTVGRIPDGALVEREVPSLITDGRYISLLPLQRDFVTASRITSAINNSLGETIALALNAGMVTVRIPETWANDPVGFIAMVQEVQVMPDRPAKILINERTGTVVIGGEITLSPVAIAHGNLTVQITTDFDVSQPLPRSRRGRTVVTPSVTPEAEEETARLIPVEGADVKEIAEALNKLQVTPRDLISIFQALKEAGALHARLEIM